MAKANPLAVPPVPTMAPVSWPDISSVQKRLSYSRTGLGHLLKREGVAPLRDRGGRLRVDPLLVDRLAAKRADGGGQERRPKDPDGAVASAVFERLARGEDQIAIVIAVKADPDVVDRHKARFDRYKGQVTYTARDLAGLCDRLGVATEPPPAASDLLAGLGEHDARSRQLVDAELARKDADAKVLREQLAKTTEALKSAAATVQSQETKLKTLALAYKDLADKNAALEARIVETTARSPAASATESTPAPTNGANGANGANHSPGTDDSAN